MDTGSLEQATNLSLGFIGVVCCLLLYLVPHNGVKHCEGCSLHCKRKCLECPYSQRRGDYPSRGIDSQALLLRGFLAVVSCSWLEEGLEFGEGYVSVVIPVYTVHIFLRSCINGFE